MVVEDVYESVVLALSSASLPSTGLSSSNTLRDMGFRYSARREQVRDERG